MSDETHAAWPAEVVRSLGDQLAVNRTLVSDDVRAAAWLNEHAPAIFAAELRRRVAAMDGQALLNLSWALDRAHSNDNERGIIVAALGVAPNGSEGAA